MRGSYFFASADGARQKVARGALVDHSLEGDVAAEHFRLLGRRSFVADRDLDRRRVLPSSRTAPNPAGNGSPFCLYLTVFRRKPPSARSSSRSFLKRHLKKEQKWPICPRGLKNLPLPFLPVIKVIRSPNSSSSLRWHMKFCRSI